MSKKTQLLKHMTEETDQCRNEHSSCTTVVALSQNVETYPTTQCKILLILKMRVSDSSVPPGCSLLNYGKPFGGLLC